MPVPNIPNWSSLDRAARADAAVQWCFDNGVHIGSIYHGHLAAAMSAWEQSMMEERLEMGEAYPYEPSPMDYVHLIRAIAAFLRSRV